MDSARHSREAGRPPRFLVLLASAALVAGTGAALWALPAAPPGWNVPPRPTATPAAERTPAAPTPETLVAARQTVPPSAAALPPELSFAPVARYRGFLDAAGEARPELLRAGVRSFAIGHVVAGPDGCTPRWAGTIPRGAGSVATRIERVRADGGEVWAVFGGPYGPEPAVTCDDPARLLTAYRRVVTALDPPGVDVEAAPAAQGAADGAADDRTTEKRTTEKRAAGDWAAGDWAAVARRRAAALARLQHEARTGGTPRASRGILRVTFTLPASADGLSPADRETLRLTREAGVEIASVGLLVPMASGPSALHGLAVAARAARLQIAEALGVPPDGAWRRMGLAPVLARADDLGPAEAARLAAFRARNGLGWLSVRGARPSEEVVRILSRPPEPGDAATPRTAPSGRPTP